MKLVAKLNPSVTQGYRKKKDEFEFNKDAGLYVCKEGHMAIRKARQGKKGVATNQTNTQNKRNFKKATILKKN